VATVFITGANRGLGLEFAIQYAAEGWKVIATCRSPETAIDLGRIRGNIHILKMDITHMDEIRDVASKLKGVSIDVLLNNAGTHGPRDLNASFGNLDLKAWHEVIAINLMAPLKITETFIENVKVSEGKTIVFISSRAGSISERGLLPYHQYGGSYIYRSSKAALNAAAQSLSFDFAPQGILVLVLHPGWVKTEMGGLEALIDIETSVTKMRRIIGEFSPSNMGVFRNYDGTAIPW
jgi:NAD(P)-dependent dehydrogenase (short-subunit alcohol dehydrogenase family)